MRELTSHKVNGLNESLKIVVCDDPGDGGACHEYVVSFTEKRGTYQNYLIKFQNGPIADGGVNGLSHESLLSIIEDRLTGFQSGQFACRENAVALTKIQEAMMWLQKRTLDRTKRGVEGTHQT